MEQSYVLENEMKVKLYLQLCTEQNKMREYRDHIQLLTQEETQRFLREKEALPKLLAEKELAFKEGCLQIEHSMQVIRIALYACMTGDIAVVESLLKKTIHWLLWPKN